MARTASLRSPPGLRVGVPWHRAGGPGPARRAEPPPRVRPDPRRARCRASPAGTSPQMPRPARDRACGRRRSRRRGPRCARADRRWVVDRTEPEAITAISRARPAASATRTLVPSASPSCVPNQPHPSDRPLQVPLLGTCSASRRVPWRLGRNGARREATAAAWGREYTSCATRVRSSSRQKGSASSR